MNAIARPQRQPSRSIQRGVRIALYLLIVVAPLITALIARPVSEHGFADELGKSLALLAFPMLALQFVLSARIHWIEHPFGLDMILFMHRIMGVVIGLLLLLHPVTLALGSRGFSLFYSTDASWFIWLARGVLVLLIVQILLSLFRLVIRLEFETWRTIHNTVALLILGLGFVHSWFAGGDLDLIKLQILWAALLTSALGLYLYHRLLRPIRLHKNQYTVTSIHQETHNVWTIELRPPEEAKAMQYEPGQFHFLTLQRNRDLPEEEHPFTISSSPASAKILRSTIKESGNFTATIGETQPGDTALVHGPFGHFSFRYYPGEEGLVFIAGGIGITPFISMLRYMRDHQLDREVVLLYANQTRDDIVFYEELIEMETTNWPDLRVVHILSRADDGWEGMTGHITGETITQVCGDDLNRKAFYVCGPQGMSSHVIGTLASFGIPPERIHHEEFGL